jgi:putative ABC transport system permease protein
MNIHRILAQGLKSLMMHRLRALLSTLGVLFGVAAVIAMLAVGEGAKQEALEQIASLGMDNLIIRQNKLTDDQQSKARQNSSSGLKIEDGLFLKDHLPGVNLMAAVKIVKAAVQATNKEILPEILAITEDFGKIKNLTLQQGRFFSPIDIQQKSRICVLGQALAISLGRQGQLGQTIRLDGIEFVTVGILNSQQGTSKHPVAHQIDNCLFIPLGSELGFPLKVLKKDNLSEIILHFNDSDGLMDRALLAKRILSQRHHQVEDFQVVVPYELMNQALRTQYTFNLVLVSIATISLLVGGIGIMNIMLATISERTREIGIRRAIGATGSQILFQFLIETTLLSLAGGLLGVIVGCLAAVFISFTAGWHTVITLWSTLISLGMAVTIGVCAGLYPAMKAAKMHPISALRYY